MITIHPKDEARDMWETCCERYVQLLMPWCKPKDYFPHSFIHPFIQKETGRCFRKYEILKCFNLGCSAVDSKKQTNKFSQKTKHEEHTVLVFYTFYTFKDPIFFKSSKQPLTFRGQIKKGITNSRWFFVVVEETKQLEINSKEKNCFLQKNRSYHEGHRSYMTVFLAYFVFDLTFNIKTAD